jgi:hypothetical protein
MANDATTTDDFEFDPQLNPEDLPDTSGPTPEGWHKFAITKARLTRSSGGNDMLANRYSVIGKDDPFEGRNLRDWIVYTKSRNGFGKLAALCQAVDPDMVSAGRDPENGFNHKAQASVDYHLLGQVFAARIEHEDDSYNDRNGKRVGMKRERIVEFRVLSDRELATLEADYGGEPRPPLPDDAHSDWPKKDDSSRGSSSQGSRGSSSGESSGRGRRGDFQDDEIPF